MKCEVCRENEATVPIRNYVDGHERLLNVCASCAARALPQAMPLMSTVDLLLSTMSAGTAGAEAARREPVCAHCGLTQSQFKHNQRLGCGHCAEAFSEDLVGMLRSMQPGLRHAGKVPARHKALGALESLERALRTAVKAQNFEEAAQLRDRIRDLKASAQAVPEKTT